MPRNCLLCKISPGQSTLIIPNISLGHSWSHSLLLVEHPHPLLCLLEDVVLPRPGALQLVAARLPPDALATLLRGDFGIRILFCFVIQGSPLTVTPSGTDKTVTVSEVSLYPTLFSIRWFLFGPKKCHCNYSVPM